MQRFASKIAFVAIALIAGRVDAQVESTTYVQADHILVRTQESAVMALTMIEGGLSFQALAFRWSGDEGTRKVGGQLDVARCDAYVPEFASFVCKAELRQPGIVKTVFGWHVVVVHSRSTDRRQVSPPDPAVQSPEFKATVSLSCGFPDITDSLRVQIDVPNRMAFVGSQLALVQATDVEFRLQPNDGDTVVIDRTTGLAVWHQSGKEPLTGLICRPTSSRRLF